MILLECLQDFYDELWISEQRHGYYGVSSL